MPTRSAFGRARLRRKLVAALGIGTLVSVALVAGTGIASAAGVTGDDNRATPMDSNINACPAGQPLLVDGGTTSTTQNGITVTVTHTNAPQADANFTGTPNGAPAGTLPAGTDVLTVTLPAGDTLTGHIYVKGGDGYNDYPGSALTQLIPPVNNGGNVAGLSHYFICGTLNPPAPQTGTLDVTKNVVGIGPGPFTITVNCGNAGTKTYSNVTNGTTETATYPAGTSCTVTETNAAGASSTTYTVGNNAASSTAPTVVIAANATTNVTVTNTFNPPPGDGTLTVDKAVVGNGPGPFTITVNCGGNVTTYSNVTDGFSQSANYPDGTSCTVTETNANGATSTTYTVGNNTGTNNPPTVTIASGKTTTVTVTNTFAPKPNGTLVVDKSVVGNGTGPFTITVDCGQAGSTTYTNVVSGTTETANYPAGTVCTVTETNAAGASSTTYTVNNGAAGNAPPAVVIQGNQTTTVVVTNTFTAPPPPPPGNGTLVVNKSVVGNGAGPFTIVVNCGNAGTTTYSNVNNGTTETVNYPDGASCTVTETNANGASSTTYTVGNNAPTSTAPTVKITGNSTTTVTVTNTFTAAPQPPDPLRIVKSVDKTKAAYGDDLTYTLTVFSGAGSGPQNVLVTDQVPAGTTFVSSTCVLPCTTGAPVGGVVSWAVGNMLPNSSFVVSFVVNITPQPAGATPAEETIPNSAVVASDGAGPVPSNTVVTTVLVTVVAGETFTQPPAGVGSSTTPTTTVEAVTTSKATLPFTGLPADQLLALAALFVITGAVLIVATRRRGATDGD